MSIAHDKQSERTSHAPHSENGGSTGGPVAREVDIPATTGSELVPCRPGALEGRHGCGQRVVLLLLETLLLIGDDLGGVGGVIAGPTATDHVGVHLASRAHHGSPRNPQFDGRRGTVSRRRSCVDV
jgi:hypothetical protein